MVGFRQVLSTDEKMETDKNYNMFEILADVVASQIFIIMTTLLQVIVSLIIRKPLTMTVAYIILLAEITVLLIWFGWSANKYEITEKIATSRVIFIAILTFHSLIAFLMSLIPSANIIQFSAISVVLFFIAAIAAVFYNTTRIKDKEKAIQQLQQEVKK
jgi:hypothetical protein